jgi:hypothetical protein
MRAAVCRLFNPCIRFETLTEYSNSLIAVPHCPRLWQNFARLAMRSSWLFVEAEESRLSSDAEPVAVVWIRPEPISELVIAPDSISEALLCVSRAASVDAVAVRSVDAKCPDRMPLSNALFLDQAHLHP